jgi:hypothetical protein
MNPDHMPRPFNPSHSDGHGPVTFQVHGGDFREPDLIRALDDVVATFGEHLNAGPICRAVDWLQQKYGMPR